MSSYKAIAVRCLVYKLPPNAKKKKKDPHLVYLQLLSKGCQILFPQVSRCFHLERVQLRHLQNKSMRIFVNSTAVLNHQLCFHPSQTYSHLSISLSAQLIFLFFSQVPHGHAEQVVIIRARCVLFFLLLILPRILICILPNKQWKLYWCR